MVLEILETVRRFDQSPRLRDRELLDAIDERLRKLSRSVTYLRRGEDLLAAGRLREAEIANKQAYQFNPQDLTAEVGQAKILYRRARREPDKRDECLARALSILDGVLLKDPAYERAYYNRACYRLRSGKYSKEKWLEDLTTAIDLHDPYREYACVDEDFDSVRDDPDFLAAIREDATTR